MDDQQKSESINDEVFAEAESVEDESLRLIGGSYEWEAHVEGTPDNWDVGADLDFHL